MGLQNIKADVILEVVYPFPTFSTHQATEAQGDLVNGSSKILLGKQNKDLT